MELKVNSSDLAKVLKLGVRRVQVLAKEEVLKREADGNFHLPDAVDAYYAFKYRTDEDLNFEREHTLLEKTKREKAEIELDLLKGKILDAAEVEKLQANMIITFRSRILSMGSKCAPKLLGQKSIPVITEIINIEAHEALNELKQIPAEMLGDNCDDNE